MTDDAHVAIWPNGDWCYGDEIEEYGRDKSDDFSVVPIPEDTENVDFFVFLHLNVPGYENL